MIETYVSNILELIAICFIFIAVCFIFYLLLKWTNTISGINLIKQTTNRVSSNESLFWLLSYFIKLDFIFISVLVGYYLKYKEIYLNRNTQPINLVKLISGIVFRFALFILLVNLAVLLVFVNMPLNENTFRDINYIIDPYLSPLFRDITLYENIYNVIGYRLNNYWYMVSDTPTPNPFQALYIFNPYLLIFYIPVFVYFFYMLIMLIPIGYKTVFNSLSRIKKINGEVLFWAFWLMFTTLYLFLIIIIGFNQRYPLYKEIIIALRICSIKQLVPACLITIARVIILLTLFYFILLIMNMIHSSEIMNYFSEFYIYEIFYSHIKNFFYLR